PVVAGGRVIAVLPVDAASAAEAHSPSGLDPPWRPPAATFARPAAAAAQLQVHQQEWKQMQFIDLGAQRERIADRLKAAIDQVVDDGRYILGPQVAEFEQALARYVGVKHVVACANGTDALLLPLMAHGVGPGDAV